MEAVGVTSAILYDGGVRVTMRPPRESVTDNNDNDDRDAQTVLMRRLLLRLKFLAFLMLAFALFPVGVGTGTILYTVPALPGYLLSALIAGITCLIQSILVVGLVSEGWKITIGSPKSCLFRFLMKFLIATTLCTILTVIAYIAFSGILGILECAVNSGRVSFHRCGPHKSFIIFLSVTNLATGSALITLVLYMSNILFRKFVKTGLTSVSKSGQVYVRLNHITSPTFVSDV